MNAQENTDDNKKPPIKVQSVIEAGYFWHFNNSKKNNISNSDSTINQLTGIYYSLLFFRDQVISLGIGTGLEYKKDIYLIPFTIEGRFNLFPKKKFQPSILISWGTFLGSNYYDESWWDNQFNPVDNQFNLGIGIKGKLNKKIDFNLTIGYASRAYGLYFDFFDEIKGNYHYLFVKTGIILFHKKRKKEIDETPFLFYR